MKTKLEKKNRKEDIFMAAVACFNENGYYKASMDLIAKRAGMTKRGLYYHFKSKDELFIQLFHHMNVKYYNEIPLDAAETRDPEKRLQRFVKIARQVFSENQDFLKFSQEFRAIGTRKPEIREVMTSYYQEQVNKVQKTIDEGILAGKFDKIDSKKMAHALVLITMGAFDSYFSLDAGFDLADQHSFNVGHMIKGMKA
ncbi:MAG: TetR/AcrR family transcriptional regulator [Proteobacteria bacterium]|nr:TetR/AcrR family transcriptional regulator [Pseudomonadota bacterium]